MAFGNFTLTGHVDLFGDVPASGRVRVDGIPQVVIDTAGNTMKVGPRYAVIDGKGDWSIKLPSDATTGNSTTIGYRVTLDPTHNREVSQVEFFARPISATVDLADIQPQVVEPVGDTAANAIRAEAAAARAEAAAGDVGDATILDAGEGFMAKLDMRSEPSVVAMLGDSTGNAANEWFRLAFAALGADHPLVRAEYFGWDDPTLEPWSDTSTGAYAAAEVVQTGTGAAVEENVVHDTFTRTAADLYGTTPEIGGAWGGNVTAQGDWSLNGSAAVATADTTRSPIFVGGGMQGDQRVRCTATITTTTSTTNRSFFLMAKWVDSNNYLYAELRTASATGVTTLWLIVRTGGVSRTIGSSANALVANQTTQTFDLEVRVTGLTAGAYMNGSATPTVSGAITDPEAAALTAATSAAFSATNQTGATVASFDLYVTGNVAATRVRAYNGSLGGTTWAQYQLPRMTRLLPEAPDVVFLSSSHNYGAMTPAAYLVEVEDTIAAVQGLWPDAGIVLVAQNPRYSPAPYRTEHARRLAALRRFARVRGCGYLPAFERFLASAADEGRSKIQADGIHPVTGSSGDTGSAFWATVANDYFRELSNVV